MVADEFARCAMMKGPDTTMENSNINIYLSDHLGGSTMAIELLERLEANDAVKESHEVFGQLRREIESDRETLKQLMARLEIDQSTPRRAVAWLGDKFTDLKLLVDDSSNGTFRLFESLEILSLGIEGKLALWVALEVAAEDATALHSVNYGLMKRRAREQRKLVEEMRLEVARVALA